VSHHTDMAGAGVLVDARQSELVHALRALGNRAAAKEAQGETVRNLLVELVVETRRNDALVRARRKLQRAIGLTTATEPEVYAVLELLQQDARPPRVQSELPPAIAGSSASTTPRKTRPRATPVKATKEVDATPTRKVRGPRKVGGPWQP
jgi:hypothetical protein